MHGLVHSPTLMEDFPIGDNTPLVDLYCPIDRTQLVLNSGYDYYHFSCFACNASYNTKSTDPDSLRQQAARYVGEIKRDAKRHREKLNRLERIINAAKQNGIQNSED